MSAHSSRFYSTYKELKLNPGEDVTFADPRFYSTYKELKPSSKYIFEG